MINFMKNKVFQLVFHNPYLHITSKESTEATIKLNSEYKCHNLDKGPSDTVKLKREDAIKYFKDMDIIRRFENSCAQMYRDKIIRGFCHLYVGEEGVGVGVLAGMRPQDICITAYRVHGISYLMGATVEQVLCELTGRVSGASRGKGGSMHLYTPRLFGGNGIVGSHIPVGVGLGFARKYMGKDQICVTMYGDGAANQGQCFEAFNLAKLFEIPVLFLCENNMFGLGTPVKRASANTKMYTRCEYIPGLFVDGMDVLAVREAVRFAIDFILKIKGPIIIECLTYRYFGHSMSDPGTSYRTKDEVQETRATRDCLKIFKSYILSSKLLTEEEIKSIEIENKKMVKKATEFSQKDKFPAIDELYTDVYVKPIELDIRTVFSSKPVKHINSKQHAIQL